MLIWRSIVDQHSNFEVIGERELNCSNGDVIRVELGYPAETKHRSEFICCYRINGIGNQKINCSFGTDKIQAMTLALQKIGSELNALEKIYSVKFFLGKISDNSHHGFPIIPGT